MIPKIVHFVFGMTSDFGGKPFHLIHNIAIRSAHATLKPEKMYMYCKYEPENNVHWEGIRHLVEIVKVEPPTEIFGNRILHYAHQSDIVRLTKLIELGGIYLDCDTLCLKPFDDLLTEKFVMATQVNRGLCNAIMLSEKESEFGKIWYNEYKSFNHQHWDQHSVILPEVLSQKYPNLITKLDSSAFFIPDCNDKEIPKIYEQYVDRSNGYSIHLWEHVSWTYIQHIDENWIRNSNCTYAHYAKKYV